MVSIAHARGILDRYFDYEGDLDLRDELTLTLLRSTSRAEMMKILTSFYDDDAEDPSTAALMQDAFQSVIDDITIQQAASAPAPASAPANQVVECTICMTAGATHAVVPCGHLCMCGSCSRSVQKCPICRGPVESLLRVYIC